MKKYIKIEVGCGGELNYEWVLGKSFEEIVEISVNDFDNNVDMIVGEMEEGVDYVNEFCNFDVVENKKVEYSLDEESSVGYYIEDLVEELKDVDLDNEDNYDLVMDVFVKLVI